MYSYTTPSHQSAQRRLFEGGGGYGSNIFGSSRGVIDDQLRTFNVPSSLTTASSATPVPEGGFWGNTYRQGQSQSLLSSSVISPRVSSGSSLISASVAAHSNVSTFPNPSRATNQPSHSPRLPTTLSGRNNTGDALLQQLQQQPLYFTGGPSSSNNSLSDIGPHASRPSAVTSSSSVGAISSGHNGVVGPTPSNSQRVGYTSSNGYFGVNQPNISAYTTAYNSSNANDGQPLSGSMTRQQQQDHTMRGAPTAIAVVSDEQFEDFLAQQEAARAEEDRRRRREVAVGAGVGFYRSEGSNPFVTSAHTDEGSAHYRDLNNAMLVYNADVYEENEGANPLAVDSGARARNGSYYYDTRGLSEKQPPSGSEGGFEGADDGTDGFIISDDDTDTSPRAACLLAAASCSSLPEVANKPKEEGLALLASIARAIVSLPASPHPFRRTCAHLGYDVAGAIRQWRAMDSVAPSRLDAIVRLLRSKGFTDSALHFAALCTNAALVLSRLDAAGAIARIRLRLVALTASAVAAQTPQTRMRTLRRMRRGPLAGAEDDENDDDMFSVASPSRSRSSVGGKSVGPHFTILERFFQRFISRPLLMGASQGRFVFGITTSPPFATGGDSYENASVPPSLSSVTLRDALTVYAPDTLLTQGQHSARGGQGQGQGGYSLTNDRAFIEGTDEGEAAAAVSSAIADAMLAEVEGSLHQSQIEFHRIALGSFGRIVEETFVEDTSLGEDNGKMGPEPSSPSPAAQAVRRLFTRTMHLHQRALHALYGNSSEYYDECTGQRLIAPQTASARLFAGEVRIAERATKVCERRRAYGVSPSVAEPLPPLLPLVVKDEDLLMDATRVFSADVIGSSDVDDLEAHHIPKSGSILALFTLLESFPVISLCTDEGIAAAKAQRRAAKVSGRLSPSAAPSDSSEIFLEEYCDVLAEAVLLVDAQISTHCSHLVHVRSSARTVEEAIIGQVEAQHVQIRAEMALHKRLDAQAAEMARLQEQLQQRERQLLRAQAVVEGGRVEGNSNSNSSSRGRGGLMIERGMPSQQATTELSGGILRRSGDAQPPVQQQRQVQFSIPTPPPSSTAVTSSGARGGGGQRRYPQQTALAVVPSPPRGPAPYQGAPRPQTFIIPTRVIRLLQRVGRGYRSRLRLFLVMLQGYRRGRALRYRQHPHQPLLGYR